MSSDAFADLGRSLNQFAEGLRRFVDANQSADIHERISDRSRADEIARKGSHLLRAATPIDFGLRTIGSALIVLALTRPRARELLDSANEAVGAP